LLRFRKDAWRRMRRCLEYVRDRPANGSNLYSPVFCFSLLVAVRMIIEIAR
jgi:hypothetical protein